MLPTYTAMLALRGILAERGSCGRTGTERRRHEDPRRPPLPGVPQHLRRPRQHRGADAARGAARARARRSSRSGSASRSSPARTTSATSAAARTGSRRSSLPTSRRRARRSATRCEGGAALLAVCGGYQLLGRGYRGRDGSFMPGAGLFGHETVAGDDADDRRRPPRLRARRQASGARSRASRTTPGGRSSTPAPSRSGASSTASGTTASPASRAAACGRAIGTYLHGPLLPRNPWLADWLLAQALAHAGRRPELEPLPDELEAEAFASPRRSANAAVAARA